jgi:hypothetical protein
MKRAFNQIIGFGILALATILPSCNKIDASDGEQIEKRFEVADFDKIVIETAGVLNYTQSAERSVEVNANEKILEILEVEVKENTLFISFTKNKTILNEDQLVFTVSDDDVYSITTSGSANVTANFDEGYDFYDLEMISSGSGNISLDAANATNADFTTSGSGNIDVTTVNSAGVDAVLSGSGNVTIHGSASTLDLNISGSGNYADHDFIADKVDAVISGSGNAKVSVSYQLNANLSGSGNLTYKGNPSIMATSSSGSGEVIDGN